MQSHYLCLFALLRNKQEAERKLSEARAKRQGKNLRLVLNPITALFFYMSNPREIGLRPNNFMSILEMFYLNVIEQLFLFVEQFDKLEVCLPYLDF